VYLLVVAWAAAVATALWYASPRRNELALGVLALVLWGASVMAFVDRFIAYAEGEPFLELSASELALGFAMVLAALLLWEAYLLIKDPKRVWRSKPS